MQFHSLTIREIVRETPDCVSISFEVPLHLRDTYRFKPGQYLTLKADINGEQVRRSYSICAAPHENDLRVAVKLVQEGVFSTYANHVLRVGDQVECGQPDGRFVLDTDAGHKANYVAFAAGSGITPIISMVKAVLHDEPQSSFVLFFGNRGFDHIIFREELEWLKSRYPDRLAVHHVFSRESMSTDLYQGYIDADKCHRYAKVFFKPEQVDQYFICGPAEMIFALKDTLVGLSVAEKRVKFELFTATKPGVRPKPINAPAAPTLTASITVIQDGVEIEFNLPSVGSTLLDAAMRAGADLPYSCKGGVCSTCKAKVLEGAVDMEINYGLEPDEVAAGYVLTCQAHPRTDRVVISFDA